MNWPGYFLLLVSLLASCDLVSSGSERKCVKHCSCRWMAGWVSMFCIKMKGNTYPPFDGFDTMQKDVVLKVSNEDIKELGKANFPPNLLLTAAIIEGSSNIKYHDSTFYNSRGTLKELTLTVGRFKFDTVFTPVSNLVSLEKLELRCKYRKNEAITPKQPIFSGPLTQTLTYLSLNNCNLKSLPASKGDFKNLEYLAMSKNQLSEVPPLVTSLPHLTELKLDHNNIHKLQRTEFPSTLIYLTVSHNHIMSVDSNTFHDAKKLTSLDLSYNTNLRKLNGLFGKKSGYSLKTLGLAMTGLSDFRFLLSRQFPHARIFVNGPVLRCDCYLLQYFRSNKRRIVHGTCLDEMRKPRLIPSQDLLTYLKQMDCSCLNKKGKPCSISSVTTVYMKDNKKGGANSSKAVGLKCLLATLTVALLL